MKRNYQLYLFIYLLCFSFSCEQPIDLELDEVKPKIAVVGQFTTDGVLEIFVSKTQSILSDEPRSYVTDASVQIYADDTLLEELGFVPSNAENEIPFYRTHIMTIEVGRLYTVRVEVPDFEPIVATSYIPEAIPFDSIDFDVDFVQDENGRAFVDFDVEVAFEDPSDEENFYHLSFIQELIDYRIEQNGDTSREQTIYATINIVSTDVSAPLNRYLDESSFLIEDETINGKSVVLPFRGTYDFSTRRYLLGKFKVELRTVPKDYYLFHTTLSHQTEAKDDPLSEGVILFNNVENGCGIFAGYGSSTNEFDILE